jgi:hypothetical protein
MTYTVTSQNIDLSSWDILYSDRRHADDLLIFEKDIKNCEKSNKSMKEEQAQKQISALETHCRLEYGALNINFMYTPHTNMLKILRIRHGIQ